MPKAKAASQSSPAGDVLNCTCSRLRRAGRGVTQLYDQALEPAGLTIGQFGLLAHLATIAAGEGGGIAIGTLAHARGMDPTTLTRNLKPLVAKGWIEDAHAESPARVHQHPAGHRRARGYQSRYQPGQRVVGHGEQDKVGGSDHVGRFDDRCEREIRARPADRRLGHRGDRGNDMAGPAQRPAERGARSPDTDDAYGQPRRVTRFHRHGPKNRRRGTGASQCPF